MRTSVSIGHGSFQCKPGSASTRTSSPKRITRPVWRSRTLYAIEDSRITRTTTAPTAMRKLS
ncbi:MAG: hypothetical protein AAF772_12500 [Acidobacteriota bacterium]